MTRSSHLLGYNNNVRHRGKVFHLQTEDSGVNAPRINTHLFADGGRIVKSARIDYSEFLEAPDLKERVKSMMKAQHKEMFLALRSGALEEQLGFSEASEGQSESAQTESHRKEKPKAASDNSASSEQSGLSHVASEARVTKERVTTSSVRQVIAGGRPTLSDAMLPLIDSSERVPHREERKPVSIQQLKEKTESDAEFTSAVAVPEKDRPAVAAVNRRQSQSSTGLFGEQAAPENTLGKAILTYLSEEELRSK